MSHKAPAEDEVLTPKELSKFLADATGTDSEEIEHGAAELEIAPPEEADIVGYGDHDGKHGFLPSQESSSFPGIADAHQLKPRTIEKLVKQTVAEQLADE